jgi:hypothetical protein
MQVAAVLEPGLYLPEAHIICGGGEEEGGLQKRTGLIFKLH